MYEILNVRAFRLAILLQWRFVLRHTRMHLCVHYGDLVSIPENFTLGKFAPIDKLLSPSRFLQLLPSRILFAFSSISWLNKQRRIGDIILTTLIYSFIYPLIYICMCRYVKRICARPCKSLKTSLVGKLCSFGIRKFFFYRFVVFPSPT